MTYRTSRYTWKGQPERAVMEALAEDYQASEETKWLVWTNQLIISDSIRGIRGSRPNTGDI
jgi:hypothetical protein